MKALLHDPDIEAGYEGLEDMLAHGKELEYTEEELEAQSEHFDVNADEAATAAADYDVLVWPPQLAIRTGTSARV